LTAAHSRPPENLEERDALTQMDGASFRMLKRFNRGGPLHLIAPAGRSRLLPARLVDEWFSSDSMVDKLIREIAADRGTSLKEILEAFEFFGYVRRRMRAHTVAELCAGHGLVGLLFAVFEPTVLHVKLLDRRRPNSFVNLLHCIARVAPWVEEKVTYLEADLEAVTRFLEPATPLVSAHACGSLTDICIDAAVELGSPVAVMPCCYDPRDTRSPEVLSRQLGYRTATDVGRTYRLEQAGYHVRWGGIHKSITPMNRIILATPE
jgi:hypothetical protein